MGSIIALLGVVFIDLDRQLDGCPGAIAPADRRRSAWLIGLVHGLLVTKMNLQPFVVTLCGLLIYRGVARFYTEEADRRLSLRRELPDAGMADHRPLLQASRTASSRSAVVTIVMGIVLHQLRCFGPLSLRGRQERGGGALLGIRTRRAW